jgi:hypothetical protein
MKRGVCVRACVCKPHGNYLLLSCPVAGFEAGAEAAGETAGVAVLLLANAEDEDVDELVDGELEFESPERLRRSSLPMP